MADDLINAGVTDFAITIHDRNGEKIWQKGNFPLNLRRELRNGVANLEICRICMGKE